MFVVNLFILIYLAILLRVKLITDLCEPLVLFLLGYHSPPGTLFHGLPHDGVHGHDYLEPWAVKRHFGQLMVVGKDENAAVENARDRGFWLRL
jgi:hypothetical protein